MSQSVIRKVPQSKLGVSEPNPAWFGNPGNEAKNPNWTNKNWLKSRFHFSFAEYSNPHNTNFGVLRVMNDDLVQPARGFGEHPHRDAEICTYVVEGSLTHQDSMGTKETLQRGAVQFMTAGRGVYHSEHNLDDSAPLRFIQMWFTTRTRGLKPNYGSFVGDTAARQNQWAHLVTDVQSMAQAPSGTSQTSPIAINQDANIYVAEIAADGKPLSFTVAPDRQAYLLCVEGQAVLRASDRDVKAVELDRHDAAEVYGALELVVAPGASADSSGYRGAHVLLVEMARTGEGRTDLDE